MFTPRIIDFQGGTNFRELGGYPAADGRHVKYGVFYRGGTLHDLQSEEDRALLDAMGLKLVLDFRSAGECKVSPDYVPDGAKYRQISAMRYENGDEIDFSPEGMKRVEQEFAFLNDLSIIDSLASYYARMPFNNPAFQALFESMIKEDVPMLFHCTSGKDRTGVGAMLILLALGCDRDVALRDYRCAGYRVLVNALDRIYALVLKRCINNRFSAFDNVFERARNAAFKDFLLLHSRYGDNMIPVAYRRGAAADLRQHLGVLVREVGDVPDRRVFLKYYLAFGVCEYFQRVAFAYPHSSSYFFRYNDSSEIVDPSYDTRSFHI